MPNYSFEVTRVPKASRHIAARYVCMSPFFQKKLPRLPTVEEADSAVQATLRPWRKAVLSLYKECCRERDEEEKALSKSILANYGSKLAMQFAMNCPPVGIVTETTARYCRETRLCPWCFARDNVLGIFRKFERAFWKQDKFSVWNGEEFVPVKFVEFIARPTDKEWRNFVGETVKCDEENEWFSKALAACKHAVTDKLNRHREIESLKQKYVLGGFMLHRIHYNEKLPWYSRSGIFVVPPATKVDFGERNELFRFKVHENATKRALVAAMCRACRFPHQWLRAPVERIIEYLMVMRKVRMVSTYVGLRGNSASFYSGE